MRYPLGVRTIAWATALRWTGWGLIEALIPIFLHRFTGNYIETALLTSAFYVFFLLTVPLAGVLADRISARTILLTSLLLYVAVGASYFLAGVTGLLAFVILARGSNGVAFSLDTVARYTYYRLHVPRERVARAVGYMIALGNAGWMLALIASLFFVNLVPLHYIFLAVPLTALLAFFLIYKKLEPNREEKPVTGVRVIAAYKDMYNRMRARGVGVGTLAFLAFAIGFFTTITTFLVPLYVYAHDADLQRVVFITGIVAVPLLFARQLGHLVDNLHRKAIFGAFPLLALVLVVIPFVPYAWRLVLIFLVAALIEIIWLAHLAIVTHRVLPERYGQAEGIMQVASNVGIILGSLLLGVVIQWIGVERTFFFFAAAAAIVLYVLYLRRRYLSSIVRAANS